MDFFNLVFKGKDVIEDLSHSKDRYARQIKFFKDQDKQLGIAVFDNNSIYGEYWIENIRVPKEYETTFNDSGLDLGVKYPIELFGLSAFPASKKVIANSMMSNQLIKTIFSSMTE
ncbi:hypothetical protein [Chroococcus sp. FPU101]|uniref:hypothetical protein n=1 Tax=Chroococcus sp. FPU101 TaxID=1974212 RepID=UPI001A8E8635|nr:hypothetical protein [Chroococcus sp. FPU101]GFE70044.1 hypothetical protein CFPU101_26540 [Chroococcus sp. FPU101]